MPDRLLSLQQVATLTGLASAAIRDAAQGGRFPAPLPLGPWRFGWTEADVRRWQVRRAPAAEADHDGQRSRADDC